MVNPFAILWKSALDVYGELFPMVGMNLLWLVISVPVVVVVTLVFVALRLPSEVAFPLAIIFALLAPSPASVGQHAYANNLVKEERVEFDVVWAGLRAYWRRSLALLAICIFMVALLAVNLSFYLTSSVPILHFIAILWLYAIVLWAMMMMYLNALLVEQEDKSIRLILRNSLLLTVDNIVPSIVLFIVLVLLSLVSIGIALLVALLTGSFVSVVQTRAVVAYLERYRSRVAKQAS